MMHITPIAYNWESYRNYAYFVEHNDYNMLVDGGNFEEIYAFLEKNNKKPDYILITHGHHDHVNGVEALKRQYGLSVISSSFFQPSYVDMGEDEALSLGLSFTPFDGHSDDSGLWTLNDGHMGAIFTGDVLFGSGCGRQFQGIDERLYRAMAYIKGLDGESRLYCGHEYTLSNIEFCLKYFSQDTAIHNYYFEVQSQILAKEPIVPLLLSKEKQVNPFLRFDDEALWKPIGATSPLDFVIKLRQLRDAY